MKRLTIIGIFVLGLIIPNIDVKAVDVSNEEELRAAIEQGGDITLTQNIEVTQPLVIDKDVNISRGNGKYILMKGNNTLMIVNSGNVALEVYLTAGWDGKHNQFGNPDTVIENQGKALEVNGGTLNFDSSSINAGKIGVEINNGTIKMDRSFVYAGEENDNYNYSGGQGMIINGGIIKLSDSWIYSGSSSIIVNSSNASLNIDLSSFDSDEENGIEINDGSIVNIRSSTINGNKSAIYLNGGTVNLTSYIGLSSNTEGKGIYINKGVNIQTGGDVLDLDDSFIFYYRENAVPNFSISINSNIDELRVTDKKGFMELINNKINLGFCSSTFNIWASQSEEERKAICSALGTNYDGPIESNELGKCTAVYINGVKQNEVNPSCNSVVDKEENNQGPEVVEVPPTSAYASIIIIVLGIICVIVSIFMTRKITKKAN